MNSDQRDGGRARIRSEGSDPEGRADTPDQRDATNDSPYQGQGTTTGLGGVGNETAGGGIGPGLSGGTVPGDVTAVSPGMSNVANDRGTGAVTGPAGGETRTRGAGAYEFGGTGVAAPGSDVTEEESDHLANPDATGPGGAAGSAEPSGRDRRDR